MTIICATGGSGGHIFPALQTALELKKRGHTAHFAGVIGKARAKIEGEGFPCHHIEARGFTDRSLKGLFFLAVTTVKALGSAWQIVGRVKPEKIIGFGGYGSFPIMAVGIARGIPCMIHEQNVVCGKANQLLSRFAKKIAVSFEESVGLFKPGKAVWTGCPCHTTPVPETRDNICRRLRINPQSKVVVLLGGSQGSHALNQAFFEALGPLTKEHGMQGVHITGPRDVDAFTAKYKEAGIPVVISPFYSPIAEIYAIADIVVGRSGAATVSELGAFGIPSVLVPYPFAGNHQKYNAEVLSRADAAILLEQKDLTADALIRAVVAASGQNEGRAAVRTKVEKLFVKDAAARVAEAVERM